jgi:hypothetical protein
MDGRQHDGEGDATGLGSGLCTRLWWQGRAAAKGQQLGTYGGGDRAAAMGMVVIGVL